MQKFSKLLGITSIEHEFSNRMCFQCHIFPPFSPTLRFMIQAVGQLQEVSNYYKTGWWWLWRWY
jgi:hypothetical protein